MPFLILTPGNRTNHSSGDMLALAGALDTDAGPSPQAVQMARMQEAVKIIHKEHDAVTAFCINKVTEMTY